jgi:hypothetical protein
MHLFAMIILLAITAISAEANDSAVETSAGGLKLRKERSVLMEKERLSISKGLVVVEYEFRNTSTQPVISEVAFPIPPVKYVIDDTGGDRDFADFKAWIDGKPIQVKKEVRAFVGDREVTADLKEAGITIEKFGYFHTGDENEITALKLSEREKLARIGALQAPTKEKVSFEYSPKYEVHLKYHWQQEFPPGKVVNVRHEYRPVKGFSYVELQSFLEEFPDSCISKQGFEEVSERGKRTMVLMGAEWVSYILTTANTWQAPINDFLLTVSANPGEVVSFCWDGKIEKVGSTFKAQKSDFVPEKELKIYFLNFF